MIVAAQNIIRVTITNRVLAIRVKNEIQFAPFPLSKLLECPVQWFEQACASKEINLKPIQS